MENVFTYKETAGKYIYIVEHHTKKLHHLKRWWMNYAKFNDYLNARSWRDLSGSYYDTIFKVHINDNYELDYMEVIDMKEHETKSFWERIKVIEEFLEDSITEMTDYIEDENNGYDDLERHDCRIAREAYEYVLNYIKSI